MHILLKKALRKGNGIRYQLFGSFLLHNRIKLLNNFQIKTVLDVGANSGQYAYYIRRLGYRNKIISFEPLSEAYSTLRKFAERDRKWDTVNVALGDLDGELDINVSKNSVSSSVLEMTSIHVQAEPHSAFRGKERIAIKRLDTWVDETGLDLGSTYVKIDTQGFEKAVLEGAAESLKEIKGLQMELSIVELYKGQSLATEMINYLESMGFALYSVEPGFYDKKTGRLLQFDGIFYRH